VEEEPACAERRGSSIVALPLRALCRQSRLRLRRKSRGRIGNGRSILLCLGDSL
jgi:hypothetical protein